MTENVTGYMIIVLIFSSNYTKCLLFVTAEERPTLPELTCLRNSNGRPLRIKREIGNNYDDLGIFLLEDTNGTVTQQIIKKHQLDGPKIVNEIFQQWINGTGKEPVSWSALIEVLKDIDLSVLAGDIEKCLSS